MALTCRSNRDISSNKYSQNTNKKKTTGRQKAFYSKNTRQLKVQIESLLT